MVARLPDVDLSALPKRVILSRKGSDAAWGGRPSIRLGTELISLPIPESNARSNAARADGTGVRYGDLPRHDRLGALHDHLRGLNETDFVHLDPDLRPELRPRKGRRRSGQQTLLFGQEGAAQRHLANQEVGPGDLFLFFGWFRAVEPCGAGWKRVGPDEHCLWGWLQVDDVHPVNSAESAQQIPWARHHPHVAHWERYDRHNCVYRARESLTFAPDLPGAGVFQWHSGLTLTERCSGERTTRGNWCLPGFFRRTGLTYNQVDGPPCAASRNRVHLRSAPIGQEFVLPAHRPFRKGEHAALGAWLASLFRCS